MSAIANIDHIFTVKSLHICPLKSKVHYFITIIIVYACSGSLLCAYRFYNNKRREWKKHFVWLPCPAFITISVLAVLNCGYSRLRIFVELFTAWFRTSRRSGARFPTSSPVSRPELGLGNGREVLRVHRATPITTLPKLSRIYLDFFRHRQNCSLVKFFREQTLCL